MTITMGAFRGQKDTDLSDSSSDDRYSDSNADTSDDGSTPSSSSSGSSSSGNSSGSDDESRDNLEVGFLESLRAVLPWTEEGAKVRTSEHAFLQTTTTVAYSTVREHGRSWAKSERHVRHVAYHVQAASCTSK